MILRSNGRLVSRRTVSLQAILCTPVSEEQELRALDLAQLESLTTNLQNRLRNRTSS
ncbi:MAG: hypothetical protein WCJ35_22755 [Planctomycetota bacterium]